MIVKVEKLLRIKSVEVPDDETIKFELTTKLMQYADNETMLGLAAPQIGIYKRAFIAWSEKDKSFRVYINPKIHNYSKDVGQSYEGCLSFPNQYVWCNRSLEIEVSDVVNGRQTVSGYDAVIIQHEFDHLQGRLMFDRIATKKSISEMNIIKPNSDQDRKEGL
jgi:peptide deformylase